MFPGPYLCATRFLDADNTSEQQCIIRDKLDETLLNCLAWHGVGSCQVTIQDSRIYLQKLTDQEFVGRQRRLGCRQRKPRLEIQVMKEVFSCKNGG